MDRDAPFCESGKRGAYPTRDAAMAMIRIIRADPDLRTGRLPTTAYECRLCNRWHLTSRKGKGHRR